MSARSPLICSAVELWYKKMLKIGSLSELTGIDTKIKVAGFQRLYSKWLWLLMAISKPSLSETENFEDWMSTHDISNLPMDKLKEMRSGVLSEVVDFRNTRSISVEDGVQKISQMLFQQFGKNGFSKDMDIQAQSDGTVRLLSLVPALYDAMKSAKTVIIDELDHSIHSHLVRELVRYFSSQDTNGQLIFTTHQTCLLNQDFLRTDEAWMVEKKDGGSHMYSLNDFKIHNTINIENGYMEGRYGAIPFIGELNM